MGRKIFLLFILFTFLFSAFSGCRDYSVKPEQKLVKEVVEAEKKDALERAKSEAIITAIVQGIGEWLSKNPLASNLFSLTIILVLGLGLVSLIIFLILRNRNLRKYKEEKKTEISSKNQDMVFRQADLEKYLEAGDYSGAIVYLHRCSILELLQEGITYTRNLTNRSLLRRVDDPARARAFRMIYSAAEEIFFDRKKADFELFSACDREFDVFRGAGV